MIRKVVAGFHSLETGLLVFLLAAMMLIAVLQIVTRNIFGFGIVSAEALVRILVLWTALVGAMMGAKQGSHIAMDALAKYIKPNYQAAINRLVNCAVGVLCLFTAYFCYQFVRVDYDDGKMAFEGAPFWVFESIMPIAFLVIGWRYLASAFAVAQKSEGVA